MSWFRSLCPSIFVLKWQWALQNCSCGTMYKSQRCISCAERCISWCLRTFVWQTFLMREKSRRCLALDQSCRGMGKALPTKGGNDTWTIHHHDRFMDFCTFCYSGPFLPLNSFVYDCKICLLIISPWSDWSSHTSFLQALWHRVISRI